MPKSQPSVTDVFVAIYAYLHEQGIAIEGHEVKLWSLLVSPEVTTNPSHTAFFKARMHELAQAGWFTDKVQVSPAVIAQSLEAIGAEIPDHLLSATQDQEAAE